MTSITSLLALDLQNEFFRNQQGGVADLTQSPGSLISGLVPNLMVLAGVVFFGFLVWGGWDMVMGAGKGNNPTDIQKAWKKISYGLIGFLIVIGSFFILQIVETLTGIDIINPPIV